MLGLLLAVRARLTGRRRSVGLGHRRSERSNQAGSTRSSLQRHAERWACHSWPAGLLSDAPRGGFASGDRVGGRCRQPSHAAEKPFGQPQTEIGREPREDGIGQEMPASRQAHHGEQRAGGQAGQQPAPADRRCAQPAESHDEGGGGHMAADEGTILLALVGRHEGRREFERPAKFSHRRRTRPMPAILERRIDKQHWPEQRGSKQEAKGRPPRMQPAQPLDIAQQQAAGEDDQQRLSDPRRAAVDQFEQRPVAAGKRPCAVVVKNPAGGQVDFRKGDEEHRQQRKDDAGDAQLNSP